MITCLIRKEIHEHRWVLFALLPTLAVIYLGLVAVFKMNESGSEFEVVRVFAISFLIIAQMIICNRLVVQEYQGKTQLFLEGLPVSRTKMLLTKYVMGLVVFWILDVVILLATAFVASYSEAVTLRFFAIMCSRLIVFSTFTYTFFFMMGLLGRYRIAIYLLLLIIAVIIRNQSSFDILDRGPMKLAGPLFSFERVDFPVQDIAETLIATLLFLGLAVAMAVAREGSVASLLAEKMSQREKVFIAAGLFAVMFIFFTFDTKTMPAPYEIGSAVSRRDNGIDVHVERIDDDGADTKAEDLAANAFRDLCELKEYLGMQYTPPLFLLNRRDLDSDSYEIGELSNEEGVLLRANFRSDDWSYDEFRGWLIDVYLSKATYYRGTNESKCWVLEGFAEYWALREDDLAQWDTDSTITRRAAYAARLGLSTNELRDWFSYRERVGQEISSAVACAALMHAHRKYGAEKVREFVSEILRTDLPNDTRSMWNELTRTVPVVWQDVTGTEFDDFEQDWIESITEASRSSFAEIVNDVPVLESTFEFSPKSASTFELKYQVSADPPLRSDTVTTFYEKIDALDVQRTNEELKEYLWDYQQQTSNVIPQRYSIGSYLRWTHAVYSDSLDCNVISGWQRKVVQ